MLNGFAAPLAQVMNGAVNDARNAMPGIDITFIDTIGPFHGHGACADDEWIQSLDVPSVEYSYHPTSEGQQAFADLINSQL